ncbi:MAG: MFS transporter [Saprospiraceae bacterium]
MSTITKILKQYQAIERPVLYAIGVQLTVQVINTAFFLLLNYYMAEEGYPDYQIANVVSYRFLAVFCLAFPVGLFIKGRRLKPFFVTAAIASPVLAHLLLLAIDFHWDGLVNILAMLWGLAYMCIQVTILPFVLLNGQKATHSEAFSLSFLTMSGTTAFLGMANYLLYQVDPVIFSVKHVLQGVATLAFVGIYFVSKIQVKEQLSYKIPFREIRTQYDWKVILQAVTPTLIISIGAGFTIPVINLFFMNVHGVGPSTFSLLGSITYFLVVCVMIFMPTIKRKFGYRIAITLFQSLAVFALFMLAATEFYKTWGIAVYVAIFFYIIRQPLMNAAGPMTSELMMYYVGKRNQEIISALNASIWSGSWFISMNIFALMRKAQFNYSTIFMLTVALYIVGVAWYAILIKRYYQKNPQIKVASIRDKINSKLTNKPERKDLYTNRR